MIYQDFNSVLYSLIFWWFCLFVFQRLTNRYPKQNTWKRDSILTFFQSILVLVLLPVLGLILRAL
ncbi:hypothetical protein AM500_13780 [Bacillus sp. FJAT-18017]|nr:hypothetical protein AM500_13780 [Bacillus sp. FJAT-18017]